MGRFLTIRAALVIGVLGAVSTLVGSAGASASTTTTLPVKAPAISESFTLLPCNSNTTLGMEGCEEHQIVSADKRIDTEVALLFTLLPDNAARSRLAGAQSAWIKYRRADCLSQSDVNEGGSESVVDYAACEVASDNARSTDLKTFFAGLTQGNTHVPKFP